MAEEKKKPQGETAHGRPARGGGSLGIPKEAKCRLGRCVVKGHNYQGGNDTVIQKLKRGICPVCGGATEEKYFPNLE